MLTVSEAALRVGRRPEAIRRWIRSGRLGAEVAGTRYLIDEADLKLAESGNRTSLPKERRSFQNATPLPNWVRIIRRSRNERSASIRGTLLKALGNERGETVQ
jgi:excisionase family DNA binding protein